MRAPWSAVIGLALVACPQPFVSSSVGLRQEPAADGAFRYVSRDTGVAFVLPAMGTEGEREQDDAGFERVVISTRTDAGLYRVIVFRPIDGTSVQPARAITRLADGLVAGQTPLRDEPTMVGAHAARRLTLPHATSSDGAVAMLLTADDRALVLAELVGGDHVNADADAFFATLELGCDR